MQGPALILDLRLLGLQGPLFLFQIAAQNLYIRRLCVCQLFFELLHASSRAGKGFFPLAMRPLRLARGLLDGLRFLQPGCQSLLRRRPALILQAGPKLIHLLSLRGEPRLAAGQLLL